MATAKKAAKKAAAKKSSAKGAAKKSTAKKSAAKKGAAKKSAARGAAKKAAAKKAPAQKAAAKAPAKKAASKSTGKKRALNPALAAPMQPSPELSAVIGSKPMPRSEVAKQMWVYIKKNGLQDNVNRRNINADDKLRPVFGGKGTVSMFEMTSLVNKHLKPA